MASSSNSPHKGQSSSMPEQINSAVTVGGNAIHIVSNSVDDMVEGGTLGPDQATVRIISMSYVTNDYNGTVKPAAVVARAIFSPLDGSNENKDFDGNWSIGAVNENDASILNDGGAIGFSEASGKLHLKNNTNFADFQKSLKDTGWDPNVLNGPTGIHVLEGYEMVIKKIPQRTRDGMSAKNEKGFDKTIYTCLKITNQPGESKRAGASKSKPAATSASKPSPTSTKPSSTPPASSGSHDVIGTVKSILTDAANTSTLKDLQLSAFRHFKDGGMAVGEAQSLARTIDEKFIEDNSMEHGLDISGTGKEAIITLTA